MRPRLRPLPLLLVGLILLQAVTVVAVLTMVGRGTEDLLRDAMGRTMMLAVDTVDQRTAQHLRPAEDAAELGATLVERGVLDSADDAELLRYLDGQVESNRSITGIYMGRPDGSFLLVSRDGATIAGGTRVKTVTVGPAGRRSVTVQRDPDGVVREEAEDPTDTFDPRARPWYEAASGADDVAWTEPYVFFASHEPGVTAAAAARDADGSVIAVVGVDLSLRDLSTFVGQMEVGADSRSILLDNAGLMIAAGDIEQVNVDDGEGGLRRAAIEELTDPVVTAGALALSRAADGDRPTDEPVDAAFVVDGRRWRIAIAPLDARPSWLAAVISPEDQFVSNVVETQQDDTVRAVLAGLAVTALALPGVLALSRRFERLAEDAVTDPSTGLANRRRFDDVLAEQLARATPSRPLCIALVDLDQFKQVNDTWGHQVGDQVLAVIASRLRGEMRDRDLVARVGGDEFAVVLVDTELDVALPLLERVREGVVERPASTEKAEIPLRITIGVAESHGPTADDPSSLMERADNALYRAKQAGRNRVEGDAAGSSGAVAEPGPVLD